MSGFAPETYSAGLTSPELASTAGVPEEAVTAFRTGTPSWKLERPGVIEKLASATGADPNAIRANLKAAKAKSYGLRAHGVQGPRTFAGQTYPSIRG